MPDIDQELLNHPYWEQTDPARLTLVQLSGEFPRELNPFTDDGVVIRVAGVPGSNVGHSKTIVGRAGIRYGIKTGRIHRKDPATGEKTITVEATSANTGQGMADTNGNIRMPFLPIMKVDTPSTKVDALVEAGKGYVLSPDMHADLTETTVEKARRLGLLPGYFNPDQYGKDWNWQEQKEYLAPQVFGLACEAFGTEPSIVAAPAGTMGTTLGLYHYAREQGLDTLVLPVMCAPKQEVPGARTRASIEQDILVEWKSAFPWVEYGSRHESFLLSYLSWPALPHALGPSFGLGFYGALSFLRKQKAADALDRFRKKDGKIYVTLFGPDSNALYQHLYRSDLLYEEYAERRPIDLEALFAPK